MLYVDREQTHSIFADLVVFGIIQKINSLKSRVE